MAKRLVARSGSARMVETTSTQQQRVNRTRHVAPATTALSRTSGAPFWVLAFFLVLGLGIAIVVALRGTGSPGFFTAEQAFVASGLALFAMAVILLAFLVTIAYVFSEVRRLRSLGEVHERNRVEDVTRQEAVNRQLRDEVAALRQREHLLVGELSKRRKLAAGYRETEGEPHVIQLEGIGPLYAARLNAVGIITVPQLVAADANEVARHVEATPELVREWQAMGRLLNVKGVGPQWAEALARVGVHDEHDLAQRDPAALAAAIAKLNEGKTRITKSDPSPATVARWVRSAGGSPARTVRSPRPASGRARTVRASTPRGNA
jgi:predicted flap endonuclease-1-like 5' DNA nuclease